ncbi:MAG: hypothetical protein JWP57_4137 [Spirosoma sp.]|nr:hypothetical protein [Spirosoma sp.]
MITSDEAEKLALRTMEEYVAGCGCVSEQDVANVLMKLASVIALGMCAVVGPEDAVARLEGTARFVEASQTGRTWRKSVLQ